MNPKISKLLLLVLVILIVIATDSVWKPIIDQLPFIGKYSNQKADAFIDLDQLTQITLSDEDKNEVVLNQQNGVWKVDDYDVELGKINSFIEEISNIQLKDVYIVSTNPDNYSNYRLADDQGVRIKLTWPDKEQSLVLGDPGQQANTLHILTDSNPNVYLIPSSLTSIASTTTDDWRDKTIVNINPDQINSITIETNTYNLELTKTQDGKWAAESAGQKTTLDTVTSQRLSQSFYPLTADSFATPEDTNAFINNLEKTTITISGSDSTLAQLELDQDNNSQEWQIKPSSSDIVYLLNDATVQQFLLSPEELL